jgi:FkbH-like protein
MTEPTGTIKCVVWDLDNTLWEGTLLEDDAVTLRPGARRVIETLDERGILQSVASRNEFEPAVQKLHEFGLDEYFLYPQINWNSKAESVRAIAQSLNIGLDAVAFVDDEPFDRDEVAFSCPEVTCLDAAELSALPDMPIMQPRFITSDSRRRRHMYRSDITRNRAEEEYAGPKEEFLASLGMVLTIFPAREQDLQRAEELTVRTHQLNATGVTYSHDELNAFRRSDEYDLLMARLEDKYGTYGHIGLALVERRPGAWTIKLLLMSCRVMSRGVGSVTLAHIMRRAAEDRVRLQAEFVPTDRNRLMLVTYRFAGFREAGRNGKVLILENALDNVPPLPHYMRLVVQ